MGEREKYSFAARVHFWSFMLRIYVENTGYILKVFYVV